MILILAELFACVIETMIITEFITRYFGFKSDKYKYAKGVAFFGVALIPDFLMTFGVIGRMDAVLLLLIVCAFFSAIYLKGSISKKVIVLCNVYLMLWVINLLQVTLISTMWGRELHNYMEIDISSQILLLCLTKFVLFIATRMILHFGQVESYRLTNLEWCLLIVMLIVTSMVCFFLNQVFNDEEHENLWFMLIVVCLIVVNVVMYYLVLIVSRSNHRNAEMNMLKIQLEQQKQYIIEVKERYQEMSKIRHDMKNYVANTLTLVENGKIEEGIAYMRKFQDMKLGNYQKFVFTDSDVINAVINSKFSYAYDKQIETNCNVLGNILVVDEFDLSILLSNLLDNAIEACENNTKKSKIWIDMMKKAGYLNICIRNTIDKSVLSENKKLETSKKDKSMHGFGMKSVREIVDKYRGIMNVWEENNEFVVDILLGEKT
ncbi:MAG: GHKL domain-containing protein [Lachnospiraceae bacterium]|nr:GHKL domain-containing protein [Lachnospiraceae bacterium]